MKGILRLGLCALGMFSATSAYTQEDLTSTDSSVASNIVDTAQELKTESLPPLAVGDVKTGKMYFEGSKRFINGGPACITCHNVNHTSMIPGGVLAKDLTDVYARMGEGITGWLSAPPFPAMATSYQNHALTENERLSLTAFLKEVSELKAEPQSAISYFVTGGIGGLICILILINILWWKRKRKMVKKEIFARQKRAFDAKH